MSEFKSWNSYRDFAKRIRHDSRFIRTRKTTISSVKSYRPPNRESGICRRILDYGERSLVTIGAPSTRMAATSVRFLPPTPLNE